MNVKMILILIVIMMIMIMKSNNDINEIMINY